MMGLVGIPDASEADCQVMVADEGVMFVRRGSWLERTGAERKREKQFLNNEMGKNLIT